jgi:hypothetical protein
VPRARWHAAAQRRDITVSSFQIAGYPPVHGTDLEVAYELPVAARVATTLVYAVTLTNASGHVLTFDPCPGYTESLSAAQVDLPENAGAGSEQRYLLNCLAAPALDIGASRTFAMRCGYRQRLPLGDTTWTG